MAQFTLISCDQGCGTISRQIGALAVVRPLNAGGTGMQRLIHAYNHVADY